MEMNMSCICVTYIGVQHILQKTSLDNIMDKTRQYKYFNMEHADQQDSSVANMELIKSSEKTRNNKYE
jgi:hypothetical protein